MPTEPDPVGLAVLKERGCVEASVLVLGLEVLLYIKSITGNMVSLQLMNLGRHRWTLRGD